MPIRYALIFCLLWGTYSVSAHIPSENHFKKYDLFEGEEPLKIELTFNYKKILKDKRLDSYHPATVKVNGLEDSPIEQEIGIKARGNFRRGFCHMPPLKLDFDIGDKSSSPLRSLGSLKLVTYCKISTAFKSYILKEYLTYKLYNQVSDYSFRVRLAEITYIDARGKRKPATRFGFFIEDIDDLADRNGCVEIEPQGVATSYIDQEELMRVHLFEYMIGNTDYNLGNLHNLKVIRSKDVSNEELILVPYDFDYSGMVNTVYAVPNEVLNIESVTDRLYRGKCPDSRIFGKVRLEFMNLKDAFITTIDEFPDLDQSSKREMRHFLEEFYITLKSDKRVEEIFFVKCSTVRRN